MPREILAPTSGSILEDRQLLKEMGNKPLMQFLSMFAWNERFMHVGHGVSDFETAIDTGFWTVANSSGTGQQNFATQVAEGGYLQGDSGTGDNDSISNVGPIIYAGDRNVGMEGVIRIDDVSENNFEIGFIDAVPGANASGVSDIDTPAAAFADGALIQYDTDQTAQGLAFVTDGSTASQNVAATTFTTTTAMVDATWHSFRIQMFGNFVACWFDGFLEAVHDASTTQSAGALEGGVLLAPWLYCRTRNTTAKFPRLQYLYVWGDRPTGTEA